MNKTLIALNIIIIIAGVLIGVNYVLDDLRTVGDTFDDTFGATITTIDATDTVKASRSVINTNFSNLNTNKLERTGDYGTTTSWAVSGLVSCDTIDTDSNGTFACGTDATGGGWATTSEEYFWNTTSTWAGFDGQFQTFYNATTTLSGFTDNSTDWDTAYGWGDHSIAGYTSWSTTSEQYFWNTTSTWSGFQSEFDNKLNASTTIAFGSCTNGKILEASATGWVCADDDTGGAGVWTDGGDYLYPTNAEGTIVSASSTFIGNFRVDGNSTTTGNFTAGNRLYVKDGGNVGINILNPSVQFEVMGDSSIYGDFLMSGNATSTGSLYVGDDLKVVSDLESGGSITFSGLTNCDTIDTDANGVLSCGTDETGSGGTGVSTSTANFIVYKQGTLYKALEMSNGLVGSSNASASTVIQWAVDQIDGSAGGGIVFLKPATYFLDTKITIEGERADDVSMVQLIGAGVASTILEPDDNVDGIHLTEVARVRIANLTLALEGSSTGLTATKPAAGAYYRSIWQSQFENLYFHATTTHTGWGMDMGSIFRSEFNNIDMLGVANGMRFDSEDLNFNPGDSTFNRIFIDLETNNNGEALVIDSAVGNMNQMIFDMVEMYTTGTGNDGIVLKGTSSWESNFNDFRGINSEGFTTTTAIQYGQGNRFDFNYVNVVDTGNVFVLNPGGTNNTFGMKYFEVGAGETHQLIKDENTDSNVPNRFMSIWAQGTGTVTATTDASTILREIHQDVTTPADLDYFVKAPGFSVDYSGHVTTTAHININGIGNYYGDQEKCFTTASTTFNGFDNVPLWNPNRNITVTSMVCRVASGTSVVTTLSDGTNNMDSLTCATTRTTDDGAIANATFTNTEQMEVDFGTVTGAVDWINFCITYSYD